MKNYKFTQLNLTRLSQFKIYNSKKYSKIFKENYLNLIVYFI